MTEPTHRLIVRAYTSDRNYHLDRPDYARIVRDEPGGPSARTRADALVNELAERSTRHRLGWRRFRITPITEESR